MNKATDNQFHVLSRVESENITAGAGTATGTPPVKSGGGTNGGTVNNDLCAIYALNPPEPGTPEYNEYLICLYGDTNPGNGPGFSSLP